MPAIPIEDRLQAVHEHYRSRINAAVDAGRMDLVDDLVAECEDEALAMILAAEAAVLGPRQVEVLDVGGWWPLRRGGILTGWLHRLRHSGSR